MERTVNVRDAMSREFVGVSESDPLTAVVELMLSDRHDCAVVLRGSDPIGVLTDREILGIVADGGDVTDATVGDVMDEEFDAVEADRHLAEALDEMTARERSALLVTERDDLVGVLTEWDVLTASSSILSRNGQPEDPAVERFDAAEHLEAPRDDRSVEADAFGDQGVCEICGTLASNLVDVNGQLSCPDCRSV